MSIIIIPCSRVLQTPAERVRARIKALLDKTAIKTPEKVETAVASFVPSPSQLEALEAESFEAASFVSHRGLGKVRQWSN